MGACFVPALGAGLGLLGGLIKNKPMEYRETPFQQQLGGFMENLMQQGGSQMPFDMFGRMQQAYAVPQSVPWAMNIMPQMFGGGGFGLPQMGQGAGMSGMGMPNMGGFNPFAM